MSIIHIGKFGTANNRASYDESGIWLFNSACSLNFVHLTLYCRLLSIDGMFSNPNRTQLNPNTVKHWINIVWCSPDVLREIFCYRQVLPRRETMIGWSGSSHTWIEIQGRHQQRQHVSLHTDQNFIWLWSARSNINITTFITMLTLCSPSLFWISAKTSFWDDVGTNGLIECMGSSRTDTISCLFNREGQNVHYMLPGFQ